MNKDAIWTELINLNRCRITSVLQQMSMDKRNYTDWAITRAEKNAASSFDRPLVCDHLTTAPAKFDKGWQIKAQAGTNRPQVF